MRSKLRCNRLLVENAQTSDEEVNTLCVGRRHTDALVLHGTKKQGCAKTQLWGKQACKQVTKGSVWGLVGHLWRDLVPTYMLCFGWNTEAEKRWYLANGAFARILSWGHSGYILYIESEKDSENSHKTQTPPIPIGGPILTGNREVSMSRPIQWLTRHCPARALPVSRHWSHAPNKLQIQSCQMIQMWI